MPEQRAEPGTAPGDPVVVVGGGPVGVTAALLLARRGIPVVILERHPAPYPLPRAVHLDGEVLRILQEIGLTERFRALSRPMPGLRLVAADLTTMAEFRRSRVLGANGHPEASMFDQPDLEELLLDAADAEPLITVLRGAVVTSVAHRTGPAGALVGYRRGGLDHDIAAPAVLGCDGADSTVRAVLDIALDELGFSESWLVIDMRCDPPPAMWEGVNQLCDPRRAGTFMRVVGDRHRWEFRILDGDDPARLSSDEGVARLLAPWTRGLDPSAWTPIRVAPYTFRGRVARRWRDRRVFLLGDAAHQTPPFVGQGLGSGLRDAHNLAWKLAAVLDGRAPEELLDSYQAEREPHSRASIRAAIAVGWALTGGQGTAAGLRRRAVTALCRLPGIERIALDATSPRLRVAGRARRRRHRLLGTLCPQPPTGTGSRYDELLGHGHTLIVAGPRTGPTAAGTDEQARVLAVAPHSDLGRWLLRRRYRAALVRPDRIVIDVARTPGELAALLRAVSAATIAADGNLTTG